jgi:hypothetical protein
MPCIDNTEAAAKPPTYPAGRPEVICLVELGLKAKR